MEELESALSKLTTCSTLLCSCNIYINILQGNVYTLWLLEPAVVCWQDVEVQHRSAAHLIQAKVFRKDSLKEARTLQRTTQISWLLSFS